mgnify:CR=1 FL=1
MVDKKQVDLNATNTTALDMKKSVSLNEKDKKRTSLSIEEKIRKVREKILKKEEVGMEGFMKSNAKYSPIYKRSPKGLEDSSMERQNRLINRNTPDKNKVETQNISGENSNLFQTFKTPTSLPKNQLRLNSGGKNADVEKELFEGDLKLETGNFVTPKRTHRWNSRFTH